MVLKKKPFFKYCKGCGRRFSPYGKFNFICPDCKDKLSDERRSGNKQRTLKNLGTSCGGNPTPYKLKDLEDE